MADSEDRLDFDPERMTEPFVDDDYDSRTGYDENFLGISVPMPIVLDPSIVAEMGEGGHVIPYEHFSVVMHTGRRIALLTAANVDGSKNGRSLNRALTTAAEASPDLAKTILKNG
ncbi:MAG: hypothetical protein OES46_13945 [Gammaproteobacteria bacterium]|nr:hypothetical protein [Gammaproteobacteria bacterium]